MKVSWIMDGQNQSWEGDALSSLGYVLEILRPRNRGLRFHRLILLDGRVQDAFYIPLYLVDRKSLLTQDGFLQTPQGRRWKDLYQSRFGAVCPMCFEERLFLIHFSRDALLTFDVPLLTRRLSIHPCPCGREAEYLALAEELFHDHRP